MTNEVERVVMRDGDRVLIKLYGDDALYSGTVIKARKQWVELDSNDVLGCGFIADENNIERWEMIDA